MNLKIEIPDSCWKNGLASVWIKTDEHIYSQIYCLRYKDDKILNALRELKGLLE